MTTPRYATRADVVRAAGGAEKLAQIADHDGDSVEDTGLVDEYLCDAEATVDSYWRVRYEITPVPVPRIMTRITAKLTVYNLKSDLNKGATLTDHEHDEHDEHIKWLQALAAGKVDPGVNPTPTRSPRNRASYTDRITTKTASRVKFKGFT